VAKASKVPVRTCIGCKKRKKKSSLVRFVYRPGMGIVLDERKRLPGRGAYVCPELECLDKAWKKKAFGRALRIPSYYGGGGDLQILQRLRNEMLTFVRSNERRFQEGEAHEQA